MTSESPTGNTSPTPPREHRTGIGEPAKSVAVIAGRAARAPEWLSASNATLAGSGRSYAGVRGRCTRTWYVRAVAPSVFCAVQTTVVVPIGNSEPEAGEQFGVTPIP